MASSKAVRAARSLQAPQVGQTVQYVALRAPCYAALVTYRHEDGFVDLLVFHPGGGTFPAFRISREPTTKVEHYWQPIP